MTYKTTEEVIVLVKKFEDCILPKSEWTHAAHLTVGLYYCLRFPFSKARSYLREGIRRLNESHNVPNTDTSGYHETLTAFWLLTIKQFLEISKCYNLADLANHLIVVCNDPKLPFRYYSRELLFSTAARKHHVSPDLDRFYLFAHSANLTTRVDGAVTMKFY